MSTDEIRPEDVTNDSLDDFAVQEWERNVDYWESQNSALKDDRGLHRMAVRIVTEKVKKHAHRLAFVDDHRRYRAAENVERVILDTPRSAPLDAYKIVRAVIEAYTGHPASDAAPLQPTDEDDCG